MKLKFALSANGYERLYNGKDHFKSYFITDDFEKEIDMENVFIYLSASDSNGTYGTAELQVTAKTDGKVTDGTCQTTDS